MPQDHDEAYWTAWRKQVLRRRAADEGAEGRTRSSTTRTRRTARSSRSRTFSPGAGAEVRRGDLVAHRRLGVRPARPARRRGRHEPSAVWDYNRAASAYTHSMQFKKPPLYGVALYKYAWTLFKQQRYESAVREFVHLLNYTDEQEKLTGDPGADFRQEAYTYIAGSLDNFDFVGPGPDEPYIARPDILDTAKSPAEAEAKLRIAIDRVQDPRIIPQDKPWTIEIYKALALEFRDHQPVQERARRLPAHARQVADGPVGARHAERDRRGLRPARRADEGRRPSARDYERKVLEARTALAEVHRRHALGRREQGQPRRAAARRGARAHGPEGRGGHAHAQRAGGARAGRSDRRSEGEAAPHDYALQEYKLAALGWLGYLKQDENAPDAYKSRYFYADALHNQVRLEVALHEFDPKHYPEPTSQEIATADAGGRRRARLGRRRPVHRQRGPLRRRPGRRRPRSRVPALAGLGRDAGRRDREGRRSSRAPRATRRSSPKRFPRRHPEVDEGARRVHPAGTAGARQAESRRGLRVLRGRPVLPLRPLQGRAAAVRGHLRPALRQGLARATRRGSASSS